MLENELVSARMFSMLITYSPISNNS